MLVHGRFQNELEVTKAQLLRRLSLGDELAMDGRCDLEDDKWEINRDAVLVNRRLGEGNFGAVFGGEYLKPDSEGEIIAVAVKTMHSGATPEEKVSNP